MPLFAVHLRREGVSPSAADRLRSLLAAGRGHAVGVCLTAGSRSVGDDPYCTETWADDDATRAGSTSSRPCRPRRGWTRRPPSW
jgi:hypothetical protein